MEYFLSENVGSFEEKAKISGVLKKNRPLLLNHVKESQNKLNFLIFSVSSNNFWEHCSRVP
jgi:hypothetical protein